MKCDVEGCEANATFFQNGKRYCVHHWKAKENGAILEFKPLRWKTEMCDFLRYSQ